MRGQLAEMLKREVELVRATSLANRLYELDGAERAGLDERLAFLAAACTVDDKHPRVFLRAEDFKSRLQADDPTAIAAWRALRELEEQLR